MPKSRNTSGKAQNGCMMPQARLETSLSLRDFKGATGLSIYDQLARQKGQVWSGQDSRYFPRNREVRPQSCEPVFIDAGRHGVSSTRCSAHVESWCPLRRIRGATGLRPLWNVIPPLLISFRFSLSAALQAGHLGHECILCASPRLSGAQPAKSRKRRAHDSK